jgi:hypothetical protein
MGARLPIVPLISRLIPNPPPVHPLIPQKSQSALISRTELTVTGIGRAQSRWSQVRSFGIVSDTYDPLLFISAVMAIPPALG